MANDVKLKEMVERMNLKNLTPDVDMAKKRIEVPDVNRPGLELAGFYKHTEPRRIVIIGDKEQAYIDTLSVEIQRERFEQLTDGYTPTIILTHHRECPPVLLEVAGYKNFPIFRTAMTTSRLMVDLISFLDERLAPSDSIHGVLISVYGKGVLICGESGMGKSETALELIRKGHILVADDRVDVVRVHNSIIGHSPELLQGMLEIRGIGIIDVAKMFGASALLPSATIDLVVSLEKFDSSAEYARVGIETEQFMHILEVDVPKIRLKKAGRSRS